MISKSRLIMGSALGLAAIAVAVDHTSHRLPEPVSAASEYVIEENGSPCALGSSPCGLTEESPCALDSSPCSL